MQRLEVSGAVRPLQSSFGIKVLIKRKVNCTSPSYFNSNVYLKFLRCSVASRGPLWTQNINIYSFIHSDSIKKKLWTPELRKSNVHALFTCNEFCRTQILKTKQMNNYECKWNTGCSKAWIQRHLKFVKFDVLQYAYFYDEPSLTRRCKSSIWVPFQSSVILERRDKKNFLLEVLNIANRTQCYI